MKNPKILLCLALVFSGGLLGESQTKTDVGVSVVAAPEMRECPEATIKDLGLWDDVFRFENLDFVLLRRQDALFSYSLVTDNLSHIHTVPNMIDSRVVEAMTWKKHQWVFCLSQKVTPFAVDLSNMKTVGFEIPGVKMPGSEGPAIHAILNAGFGPGTIIAIHGDDAAGWPRDGNRPLYYWMNLESGKVVEFPTGWDLDYFSADQRRAVFGSISTNAMMYHPWVTVDMATGEKVEDLPDQTKGLWSEPIFGYSDVNLNPWGRHDYHRHIWELRSPRTPQKLLHPQPGRGFIDDKFAGLSLDGADYPLTVPGIDCGRCFDAGTEGNLAIFEIMLEGAIENSLWAARLNQHEPPRLVATNCSFEMLGDQRCALLVNNRNHLPEAVPEPLVYDVESNTAWDVLDGVPLRSDIMAQVGSVGMETSGAGPRVAFRLIPGFGSTLYAAKVLCLCSTANIVPANVTPPRVQNMRVLLTAQGRRYQINLPPGTRESVLNESWLHNSGKLIVCEHENSSENRRQLHLYMADLRVVEK